MRAFKMMMYSDATAIRTQLWINLSLSKFKMHSNRHPSIRRQNKKAQQISKSLLVVEQNSKTNAVLCLLWSVALKEKL